MKKFIFAAIIIIFAFIICISCDKEKITQEFEIEGLTYDNFPLIDGSTSTDPLVKLIACRLLGNDYFWFRTETWGVYTDLPEDFVAKHLKSSQTHNAFINLIDNKADMIFSARKMSPDEKAYAAKAGVTLIETPIALDALIFIVNSGNHVNTLSQNQLQNIYSGKIKYWHEVGGNDAAITPYVRNKNSGSQELFEDLVLPGDKIPDDLPEDQTIYSMMFLFTNVQNNINGLGFTVYYYKENIIRDLVSVNTLAVNGVEPDYNTIKSGEYPYASEVYVIIRSDLDRSASSMAFQLYALLQKNAAKAVIQESGYVPF